MTKEDSKAAQVPALKASKAVGGAKFAICVPSSVISRANAKNLEQITHIAYQVAKAATIFQVSEIVILDVPDRRTNENDANKAVEMAGEQGNKKITFNLSNEDLGPAPSAEARKEDVKLQESDENEGNALLFATILQYFVTPPYLVKGVFQDSKFKHKFKYAEKLPKLSTLPFMNSNSSIKDFKEGLSIPKHTPKIKKKNKKVSALKKLQVTKYVNIGKATPLVLEGTEIPVNVRVTIDVKNRKVVSPQTAYGTSGTKGSFGYLVRYAKAFSAIFTELTFPNGYTESIYIQADEYFSPSETSLKTMERSREGTVLLVVGNLLDLKNSFAKESIPGVNEVTDMFDGEIKVPSGLRIEDAVMIGLTKAT